MSSGGCCSGQKSCAPPPVSTNESACCKTSATQDSGCCKPTEKKSSGCCKPNEQKAQNGCCKGARDTQEHVQDFYGSKISGKELGSTAPELCCPLVCKLPVPKEAEKALTLVHPDVINSSFGCGLPYPNCMQDCHVLDLGSGAGKDCFVLSYMVGAKGRVVGVDMTDAMLQRSSNMIPYHTEKFGYGNVEFKKGTLESLVQIDGLKDGTFDVVISNCVINLCADKRPVFQQVFDLLKPGGELFFSDIYCDHPLPKEVVEDKRAWNECFSGALPWSEFVQICADIGFVGPFVVDDSPYKPLVPELIDTLRDIKFWSKTVRLFKPAANQNEDKDGHVTYLGTIDGQEEFLLSEQTVLKENERVALPSREVSTLKSSRYVKHLKFE